MKLFSIVIFGLILNLSNLTYANSFRDCGSPGASVSTFSLNPCSSIPCVFKRGGEFTLLFTFTGLESVSAGKSKVHAAFEEGFGHFSFPNSDVCECLIPSCPISQGRFYTYSYTGKVPETFHTGLVTIQWQLLDTDDNAFLCIQFTVKVE
ncbi:Phosphatidylglycerol/phosphatidylinositol transfer protein [Clonorchis sinensis]|uniref:Phosphatidylglycerol/phosphatidylinositol transfer protein n=1 Tax=Clonorchis sinensis TaxID=79923 RepID=A0A8T1N021_CLOSI|nr:Phosphatidylglycerol/phosphatidylinositol transfer protein [Clonorchis sinensis]